MTSIAISNGQCSVMAFGLSTAFDMVDHCLLFDTFFALSFQEHDSPLVFLLLHCMFLLRLLLTSLFPNLFILVRPRTYLVLETPFFYVESLLSKICISCLDISFKHQTLHMYIHIIYTCIYIYIYMYIHIIHIHIHYTYTYTCIYTLYIHMYIYIYVYTYIYLQ